MSNEVSFTISGQAWSVISGSELSQRPEMYDGGSVGARDAFAALSAMRPKQRGKGTTYAVTVSREGADTIRDYCETVGQTFAMESEAETRADGRALLLVADRIAGVLA